MNPLIQLKQISSGLLVAFGLACFGLSSAVQAVSPAPDGGYPHYTTAEGDRALFSLTSGLANTAVGWSALSSVTNGSYNTGIGAGALFVNTGNENTATGVAALLLNTTGAFNTANGAFALVNNTTGIDNAAMGNRALQNNTTGFNNAATGAVALFRNTTGAANTANGLNALANTTTGGGNTACGAGALASNSTGNGNTANGLNALVNSTTGGGNIALGFGAGLLVTTANNVICIGADGADVSDSCYVGQIFGQPVNPATAVPVFVDSTGKLGTAFSSRRFKHDIKPMDKASEVILALKPVTFHYKSDNTGTPQFGLIAEEVAAVNPHLVVRDKNGDIYTVRYDAVNAMLLNEFLKEHRRSEKLEATVAQQQKQIEALTAGLQKVSAQLEASKTAPHVVNNP